MSFALLVLNISIDQFQILDVVLPTPDARFANFGRHRRVVAA
jgi:hypothetical protein